MNTVIEQVLQYWTGGGLLMLPIALVSVGIWFYFLRTRAGLLHVAEADAPNDADIAQRLAGGAVPDAAGTGTRGVLAQLVVHALDAAGRGDDPSRAAREFQERVVTGLTRDIGVLAALTRAAPLLGLLGTVVGMILTFRAVAGSTGETAERVASGISQALITTQFGLVVAIPGFFGVARLRRLCRQATVRMAACRSRLMIVLLESGKGGAYASRTV